jgi:hypothetical protein
MKKTITLFTIVLTVLISSCSKSSTEHSYNGSANQQNQSSANSSTVKLASSWFSPELSTGTDRNSVFLTGRHYFETPERYDKNLHVELGYVMMPGQRVSVYKLLPMRLTVDYTTTQNTNDKVYSFEFAMDNQGFILTIKNAYDVFSVPDPIYTENFKYRYIVISKKLYENLAINWDNYIEVAQALNL